MILLGFPVFSLVILAVCWSCSSFQCVSLLPHWTFAFYCTISSVTIIISFHLWSWNLGFFFVQRLNKSLNNLLEISLSFNKYKCWIWVRRLLWITTQLGHEIHQMSLHKRKMVTNESLHRGDGGVDGGQCTVPQFMDFHAQRRQRCRWRSVYSSTGHGI